MYVCGLMQASAKAMIAAGVRGRIVLVSSVVGLMGLVGYAQYAPMKYAIRGLAECLRSEFVLYGIAVQCYFPATILSPGFDEEQKTKPQITKDIEGADDQKTPAQCAACLVRGVERGHFCITDGLVGTLLRVSSGGSAPGHGLLCDTLLQIPARVRRETDAVGAACVAPLCGGPDGGACAGPQVGAIVYVSYIQSHARSLGVLLESRPSLCAPHEPASLLWWRLRASRRANVLPQLSHEYGLMFRCRLWWRLQSCVRAKLRPHPGQSHLNGRWSMCERMWPRRLYCRVNVEPQSGKGHVKSASVLRRSADAACAALVVTTGVRVCAAVCTVLPSGEEADVELPGESCGAEEKEECAASLGVGDAASERACSICDSCFAAQSATSGDTARLPGWLPGAEPVGDSAKGDRGSRERSNECPHGASRSRAWKSSESAARMWRRPRAWLGIRDAGASRPARE